MRKEETGGMGRYYLQEVRIVLAKKAYEAQAAALKRRLAREGVSCRILRLPEAAFNRDSGNCLWISDDDSVTNELLSAGNAVLALRHAENGNADFSACRYACEDLENLEPDYLERVYRRYRRLPWDILETERCLVRETTEEDVDEFYRIYREPSITEYMEGLYEDPEQERVYARDYIDQVYSFYEFGIWTVVDKKTGQVIGRAGICYREGYEEPEIGFVIAKDRQRRGYATEVCRAVLAYAKEVLGFPKVLAFVRPENKVSVHICKKLGLEIVPLKNGIAGR